jgi:hypothetical protein
MTLVVASTLRCTLSAACALSGPSCPASAVVQMPPEESMITPACSSFAPLYRRPVFGSAGWIAQRPVSWPSPLHGRRTSLGRGRAGSGPGAVPIERSTMVW